MMYETFSGKSCEVKSLMEVAKLNDIPIDKELFMAMVGKVYNTETIIKSIPEMFTPVILQIAELMGKANKKEENE